MKKLSTLIVLVALMMPVTALAQTETLIGSNLENGGFGGPTVKFSQFAGEPTLDPQGNLYFVHHFYDDGVMLEVDIYVAYRK